MKLPGWKWYRNTATNVLTLRYEDTVTFRVSMEYLYYTLIWELDHRSTKDKSYVLIDLIDIEEKPEVVTKIESLLAGIKITDLRESVKTYIYMYGVSFENITDKVDLDFENQEKLHPYIITRLRQYYSRDKECLKAIDSFDTSMKNAFKRRFGSE